MAELSKDNSRTDDRAIGLFDSGIGGLTILRSLTDAFPNESFVYLGDTARLPYGSKSPDTIRRYLLQNVEALLALDVKCVVVACNTASTVLLKDANDLPSPLHSAVPIYNVIEPGSRHALLVSQGFRIGVIATTATIASQCYTQALRSLHPTCEVHSRACPLLVPLVEDGWEEDPITNLILYRYLQPLLQKIDTLIMGCTHYPALRNGITRVTGQSIRLVDSSEAIVELLRAEQTQGRLGTSRARKNFRLLVTDASPVFSEVAARLLQPLPLPELELINL